MNTRVNYLVASPHSGAGKNTFGCALIRKLVNNGVTCAPLKPIAIDSYRTATNGITPSLEIQCLAANKPLETKYACLNVSYESPSAREPTFYLSGKMIDVAPSRDDLATHIKLTINSLLEENACVVAESSGGFAEWVQWEHAAGIITGLDPKIILVGDFSHGGGLASLVGTLELLDQSIRERITTVIFNKVESAGGNGLLKNAVDFVEARYDLKVAGFLPDIENIGAVSEDFYSKPNAVVVERDLSTLVKISENKLDWTKILH